MGEMGGGGGRTISRKSLQEGHTGTTNLRREVWVFLTSVLTGRRLNTPTRGKGVRGEVVGSQSWVFWGVGFAGSSRKGKES